MGPTKVDLNINYRRLQELAEELFQLWRKTQAVYLDAVAGFAFVRASVENRKIQLKGYIDDDEYGKDNLVSSITFTYDQIFRDEFCASGIHRSTLSETIERNSPNGDNFVSLGQYCVIALSAYWNDYLRKEYVIAKGLLDKGEKDKNIIDKCLRNHASNDFWGDLCKLRNSIVHNQGIANSEMKKCRFIRWFSPGDYILLTPDRMEKIFLGVLQFRNDLYGEGFPKFYLSIPN